MPWYSTKTWPSDRVFYRMQKTQGDGLGAGIGKKNIFEENENNLVSA